MDQAFDQQQMLAFDFGLVTEENLEHTFATVLLTTVLGFDELADHGDFKRAHQIGHEHKAVFQQGQGMDGFSLIVVGNLASHFAHPLLNLLGGDDGSQSLRVGGLIHGAFSNNGSSCTSRTCFSFSRGCKLAGAGNPRTQITSEPLTTTGHSLRSGPDTCRSCSNSLTFLGDFECAGQKRSPGCQFRTANSLAKSSGSKKCWGLYPWTAFLPTSVVAKRDPSSGTSMDPGTGRRYS